MKDNEENGGEEQDNPTLFDIVRKNPTMTYNEATKVQEDTRLEREAKKGEGFEKEICELRNDNRQLSKQIEDQVDKARKAGL